MAKKRKAPRPAALSGPREVDPKDASLKIRTFEDVADSEDEYYINKDRIDFDDEPRSKRARRQEREEDFLEDSEEEILAEDDSDEEDAATSKKPKAAAGEEEWEDEEEDQEGEGDEGFWGTSKKDYYNADQIENENDALEEEQEARRIQTKKLAKMSEADFMFDENEWGAPESKATEDADVVTEVLKEVEITEDMGPEERQKVLQARYPEFELLVNEFSELQPLLGDYKKNAEGKPARSLEVVKYWVAGSYLATLASYFAILTSPARDVEGSAKTIDPAELRDHEIMGTLMECRDAWLRVKGLRAAKSRESGMLSPPDDIGDEEMEDIDMLMPQKKTKESAAAKAARKKATDKAKRAKAVEASLADLSSLLENPKKVKSKSKSKPAEEITEEDGDDSDFGEEDALDARTASDKAKRKKSLRFYTSQIVQKSNRRAEASRDAGGDVDIPYRERLRDRQARLNAEAERRGQKGTKGGADLGDDESNDEDAAIANQLRDAEDEEYYDMVAHSSKRKKEDKAARHEALLQAGKDGRVVPEETVGADGKRKITYSISKNKGLTPMRRRKDKGSSNPRLKKRLAYQSKLVKQKSMRSVYAGGEAKGGYQGETSGIKTGLIKSVKLG